MILVDSSVLIDYLRGAENDGVTSFEDILTRGLPFGLNHLIYTEVLQGARTEKDYRRLKKYLDSQTFYGFKNGRESYAEAARMYCGLRQRGITAAGTVDCLIARTAIENDLFLLHHDAEFDRICRHYPLKIWRI